MGVAYRPGQRTRPGTWCNRCLIGDDDLVAAALGAQAEPLLEQAHEAIDIRRCEAAADEQAGSLGVGDDELAFVLAIEFFRCHGECGVIEHDTALTPCQPLRGPGWLDLGAGNLAGRGSRFLVAVD